MGSNMQGMDTEMGRAFGSKMGSQAEILSGTFTEIMGAYDALDWLGKDADEFGKDMHVLGGHVSNASASIQEQGQVLIKHADAQDEISS
jgi:hypothetical protein